ncbi:PREDICTED: thyroglobulin-like [Branchiostoma belcheri]|uniref:Thyroglobulin-like n=1 Tax=Branchiostoma belcheri TaxID=7741 RepID=A0A6P5AE62_BRABE|nr:PREDICTED: thyroglobulin-like [Branchiostoma belcheri]
MKTVCILLCFVYSVYGLSCVCDYDNLAQFCGPAPTNCPAGTVRDPCGCCDVCAKVQGERCDGPYGVYGTCAAGLVCEKDDTDQVINVIVGPLGEDGRVGTCVAPASDPAQDAPTQCETQRQEYSMLYANNAAMALQTGAYKPTCTPEGFYAPVQCDGLTGECWCSLPDGTEIKGTRTQQGEPTCF